MLTWIVVREHIEEIVLYNNWGMLQREQRTKLKVAVSETFQQKDYDVHADYLAR